MLTESDKFYVSKHPDQPVDEVIKALGRKETKALRAEVEKFRAAAAAAAATATARDQVTVRTGEKGKKVAAMTAAGAMQPVIPPPASDVPSRHLKNAVHKIGGDNK